jgi:hypothetical protein
MRDQATVVFPRKGYKANLTFDSELKTKYKKDYNSDYGIGFWLGKPVSLFFALSVIGVAIGNRYLNNYVTKSAHNETPSVYMMQLPTIFYVGATLLLGGIYAKVAAFIAKRENHRDEQSYESSLSSKRFIFDFVNNYISLYLLAFWDRSLAQLAQNLMTVIVIKQFLFNGIYWFSASVVTRLKIKRIQMIYGDLIKKESDPHKKL